MKISSYVPEGFIPLDNSAIIYPPTEARFNANTFRVSMDLDVPVDTVLLSQALDEVLDRLPYFKVALHEGFFWYYLTPCDAPVRVFPESSYPCGRLDRKGTGGYLFKVFCSERRIAIEFFHALTDGTGGMVFLKMLVGRYLQLAFGTDAQCPDVPRLSDAVEPDEFSDPFQGLYDPEVSSTPNEKSAFHLSSDKPLTDAVRVISGTISACELKKLAKAAGATVTEYLAAVLIDAIRRLQADRVPRRRFRKTVGLSIPVNLRNVFGARTMRNFTLFATVGIEPSHGEYSLDEIVSIVHHQLKLKVERRALISQMKRNVGGERSRFLRFVPNIVKRPLFKLLSDSLGDDLYSSVLSNLGMIDIPQSMAAFVRRCDFFLSPSKLNKISCAVIGFKDDIMVNFTSFLADDAEVERLFFTDLVRRGLHVKIQTNRTVGTVGKERA
ncbi:MAG: hypothetical protein ACOX6K_06390 [Sphaerochaetaceae bacterium]